MKEDRIPLSFTDARKALQSVLLSSPVENIAVNDCYGSVLADDIVAPFRIPRYTNSAMDGFAVRANDCRSAGSADPCRLQVTATITAGNIPETHVKPGTCCAIMTGGILPAGADAVVKVEDAEREGDVVKVKTPVTPGENVRHAGDETSEGDIILRRGTRVNPAVAGLASTVGAGALTVYTRPRVAMIITGDEISPPGRVPPPGTVSDAAGPALRMALTHDGFRCVSTEYVPDNVVATRSALESACEHADCSIIVGGASMGECDYVQDACMTAGVKEVFWKVAVKPGKPLWCGTLENQRVFNVPGNPVSVCVSYCLFVRWFLLQWAGYTAEESDLLYLDAALAADMEKTDPRREFVRGTYLWERGRRYVKPLPQRRSDMLSGMAIAECLIQLPEGPVQVPRGQTVTTLRLPW